MDEKLYDENVKNLRKFRVCAKHLIEKFDIYLELQDKFIESMELFCECREDLTEEQYDKVDVIVNDVSKLIEKISDYV